MMHVILTKSFLIKAAAGAFAPGDGLIFSQAAISSARRTSRSAAVWESGLPETTAMRNGPLKSSCTVIVGSTARWNKSSVAAYWFCPRKFQRKIRKKNPAGGVRLRDWIDDQAEAKSGGELVDARFRRPSTFRALLRSVAFSGV
jgi:hypothetical protein